MSGSSAGFSRRQVLAGGLGALGAIALGGTLASAATNTSGGHLVRALPPTAAIDWIAATYEAVFRENLTPPAASRAYGYVSIAMYEAMVAGMPGSRSLGGQLNGLAAVVQPVAGMRVDWPAAMAAAVLPVLRATLPFRSDMAGPLLDQTYAAQLAARRSAGVSERQLRKAVDHGTAVGRALVRWIVADGYAGTVNRPYLPATGEPHLWESTPPNYRPAIEPYWSEVRPLVLRRADEVEPAPHVPFSTEPGSHFHAEAMATYNQSLVNTDEQRGIANFWTDNPASFTPPVGRPTGLPSGHWMLITSQVAQQHRLDLARTVEASRGWASRSSTRS